MRISAERRAALTAKAREYASYVEQAEPYLLDRGISLEVANMFSLGYVPYGKEFAGRLAIPYLTPAGVVQMKYRCTDLSHGDHKDVECPKYLYEAGCGVHLYNAQVLISTQDSVVLTEGELDAICVQAYCGILAVAYPGTRTWLKQRHWKLCFEGISEVIVIADGDKPGREAAGTVAESIGPQARVVAMPAGTDANSFIASHGADAFKEKIR